MNTVWRLDASTLTIFDAIVHLSHFRSSNFTRWQQPRYEWHLASLAWLWRHREKQAKIVDMVTVSVSWDDRVSHGRRVLHPTHTYRISETDTQS